VRWSDGGGSAGDLIVDHLSLNEFGPYLWPLSITLNREDLERWRTAPHLDLTVSVREAHGVDLVPRQTYVLPDDDRQDALTSFIQSCFGAN
jgi:hypothetical protein